jgi:glycosyltransferase involved in cell wall biosynthesis
MRSSMDGLEDADRPSGSSRPLFVIVSFEGPDLWSQAGGLGVRVTNLAETLAELGYEVHAFYVGDPSRPGEEIVNGVVLHRWAQWLSRFHNAGVYDGEEAKHRDVTASLPPYLTERVLLPAIRAGRIPVVLLEEWQTAECASRIADLLESHGVRHRALLAWNANNAYSFERIDWPRLAASTTITTVSRFMRAIIRARGIDALVIPNGIPHRLTLPVSRAEVNQVRSSFDGRPFFFKMARWGDDKGWTQALDAVRLMKSRHRRTMLVARSGGPSGGASPLDDEARRRGLRVMSVDASEDLRRAATESARRDVDVLSLRFGVRESLARRMFAAADGILANSVAEPFGLVGLEAMAAGGLLYTGGTGEDYAVSGRNAVVLETLNPSEIADRAEALGARPQEARRIRRAARTSARDFSWQQIARRLLLKLQEQAKRQGLDLGVSLTKTRDQAAASEELNHRFVASMSRNAATCIPSSSANTANIRAMP